MYVDNVHVVSYVYMYKIPSSYIKGVSTQGGSAADDLASFQAYLPGFYRFSQAFTQTYILQVIKAWDISVGTRLLMTYSMLVS